MNTQLFRCGPYVTRSISAFVWAMRRNDTSRSPTQWYNLIHCPRGTECSAITKKWEVQLPFWTVTFYWLGEYRSLSCVSATPTVKTQAAFAAEGEEGCTFIRRPWCAKWRYLYEDCIFSSAWQYFVLNNRNSCNLSFFIFWATTSPSYSGRRMSLAPKRMVWKNGRTRRGSATFRAY